jgi:hypothetical protein
VNSSTAATPPAGEQALLGVLHGLELGDQGVGGLLVAVDQPDPAARRPVGPDVGDQRLQDPGPPVGDGFDLGHAVDLARVVADQLPEVGDGPGSSWRAAS